MKISKFFEIINNKKVYNWDLFISIKDYFNETKSYLDLYGEEELNTERGREILMSLIYFYTALYKALLNQGFVKKDDDNGMLERMKEGFNEVKAELGKIGITPSVDFITRFTELLSEKE